MHKIFDSTVLWVSVNCEFVNANIMNISFYSDARFFGEQNKSSTYSCHCVQEHEILLNFVHVIARIKGFFFLWILVISYSFHVYVSMYLEITYSSQASFIAKIVMNNLHFYKIAEFSTRSLFVRPQHMCICGKKTIISGNHLISLTNICISYHD